MCVNLLYLKAEVVFHVYRDLGPHPVHVGADLLNVPQKQRKLLLRVCGRCLARITFLFFVSIIASYNKECVQSKQIKPPLHPESMSIPTTCK